MQRDIPRILEALLLFLTALEEAQKEIAVADDAEEAARAFDVYSLPADGTFLERVKLAGHSCAGNSDEGGNCAHCANLRASINCLPIPISYCRKAAGIC